MADIHPGNEPGSSIRPASPHASNGHGAVNPNVRFEEEDVSPRNVVVFLSALTGMLVVLGVLLLGLFMLLRNREEESSKKEQADLPFATTVEVSENGPQAVGVKKGMPTIEGVHPSKETGRAWADRMEMTDSPSWMGYNVRMMPPPEAAAPPKIGSENPSAKEEKLAGGVQAADEAIAQVAGKLPSAKNGKQPVDRWRQSHGEGSSGRITVAEGKGGEGVPEAAPKAKEEAAKGKGGEEK